VVGTRTGRLLRGLPVLLALTTAIPLTPAARPIAWADLPAAIHVRLEAAGVSSSAFPGFLDQLNRAHAQRVREGDLDHLVFYLLQSTHFTRQPPIEPALSARALVDALLPRDRTAYLQQGGADVSRVPAAVRTRARDLLRALDSRDRDPRVAYFRQLAGAALPGGAERETALQREYLRAMQFLYQKEFVAQRAPDAADAVASLYRSRGLSTDTAIEAGYVVYLGLGVLKSLEPGRRVRRVLIIGPGLDLAPRTALIDAAPPESYQPWAVIDALVGLGLARVDELEVVGADINPRVVDHLRRARAEPPSLTLVSGIQESPVLTLTPEYRDYFTELGRSIGHATDGPRSDAAGRLRKTVRVGPSAARALTAHALDVVTESLDGPPFDLVIATNILPYFDDAELMLAMSNVARMLAPGGVFLHNEARPLMHELTAALGMPVEQSRHAIIASVKGAAAPLFDSVWLHRKAVK
jgi:SAM-dependent methyltransferase